MEAVVKVKVLNDASLSSGSMNGIICVGSF